MVLRSCGSETTKTNPSEHRVFRNYFDQRECMCVCMLPWGINKHHPRVFHVTDRPGMSIIFPRFPGDENSTNVRTPGGHEAPILDLHQACVGETTSGERRVLQCVYLVEVQH